MSEQKILKCAFTEWNNKQVISMPLDRLWISVPIAHKLRGQPFFEPLKEDIITNGLHFPILVVECTYADLKKQKNKHKQAILDLPEGHQDTDIFYVVWGGSNRTAAAKELGYSHVDCVIYPNGNFDAAFRDQALHRQPYMQLYQQGVPLRSFQQVGQRPVAVRQRQSLRK